MSVEVTLYYANWCGHCIRFKPDWEIIKNNMKGMNNVKFFEFEDKDMKNGGATINGEPISGFPTIKVKLNANGKTKEYDYSDYAKSRDAKYMTTFISSVLNKINNLKKK